MLRALLTVTLSSLGLGCASGAGPRTGFADVNGTRLAYEVRGEGDPVVLIHGGLVDSRMWDDQVEPFAQSHRVIRYDLRGFGKSAFSTGPFSHVEDLKALLDDLHVERASLVGVSVGGNTALDFALEHPERVADLVLVNSSLRGYKAQPLAESVAVNRAAAEQGMETAIELWLRHPLFASGRDNPEFERRMRQMLADNWRFWGPENSITVTWPSPPTLERLSAVAAPTLIVVGDRDAPHILGMADSLATRIPGARRVFIQGASHHPNMERPAEFNRIVLEFLSRTQGA